MRRITALFIQMSLIMLALVSSVPDQFARALTQHADSAITLGIPDTLVPFPSSDPGLLFPSGFARALAFNGSDLYVGGGYSLDPAHTIQNIMRFNTATNTWSGLANGGLDWYVTSLAMHGSDLYVGGRFTQTLDGTITNLNRIARFDTLTNTWHALPNNGLNGDSIVYAMTFIGDKLYVGGGWFTGTADGTVTDLNNIAIFDTSDNTWHAFPNNGLVRPSTSYVNSFAIHGTDVYVGGLFTQTADGSIPLNNIARLDTTDNTWHALPNNGLDDEVGTLLFNGDTLYVGGWFTQTKDGSVTDLNTIARLDTSAGTWSALANKGFKYYAIMGCAVCSFGFNGSDLYIGGAFTGTFDDAVLNLNGIARYDTLTDTWHSLPHNGFVYDNSGDPPASVRAIVVDQNEMYLGGYFYKTFDDAIQLNGLARLFTDYAPTDISLSNNKVDGSQVIGTTVGTLSSTDPNPGDIFIYSLCGGADDSSFQIFTDSAQNRTSYLATKALLTYAKGRYSVCIRSTDAGGLFFDKTFIVTINPTFKSVGANDGWIRESTETSNSGGSLERVSQYLNTGDDSSNRQYKTVLSFNTASIPDKAVITRATLKIRYAKQVGPNAFSTLGKILVDIKMGGFLNSSTLQIGDFQAAASKSAIGSLANVLQSCGPSCSVADWYVVDLSPSAITSINKTGITQFRLRFQKDDNNNRVANEIIFYSGNAPEYSKPALIVEYH